jgi:hypothetical protein
MRMSLRSLMSAALFVLIGMILGDALEVGQHRYVLASLGILAGLLAIFMPGPANQDDTRESTNG